MAWYSGLKFATIVFRHVVRPITIEDAQEMRDGLIPPINVVLIVVAARFLNSIAQTPDVNNAAK